jgi:hypothetical protein
VTAPIDCRLVGRWRIVEADLWDRDDLDLVAPAAMTIGADGHGEIAYRAMQAGSISNTAARRSSSPGPASTKWTTSAAPERPNCKTTARSRSRSPTTAATRPS